MFSIEFIAKSMSCLDKLNLFLKKCNLFSDLVLIDNKNISNIDSLTLANEIINICDLGIFITISIKNKSLEQIEKQLINISKLNIRLITKPRIRGVIFVSGDELNKDSKIINYKIILKLTKNLFNGLIFNATNNMAQAKQRLEYGFDGIITQSFYSISKINKIINNNKIIPSFFPFFNEETLSKWRDNKLGINIPNNYSIKNNKNILKEFIKLENLHISMINTNFKPLLKLIESIQDL